MNSKILIFAVALCAFVSQSGAETTTKPLENETKYRVEFGTALSLIDSPKINKTLFAETLTKTKDLKDFNKKFEEKKGPLVDALVALYKNAKEWKSDGEKSTDKEFETKVKVIVSIIKEKEDNTVVTMENFEKRALLKENKDAFDKAFKTFQDSQVAAMEEVYYTIVPKPKEDAKPEGWGIWTYILVIGGIVLLVAGVGGALYAFVF